MERSIRSAAGQKHSTLTLSRPAAGQRLGKNTCPLFIISTGSEVDKPVIIVYLLVACRLEVESYLLLRTSERPFAVSGVSLSVGLLIFVVIAEIWR